MGVSNTVQQLSVFLENREGRLEEVLDVLAKSNVNIVALSLADTSDYGMLRMIVSDPHKGRMALKEVGITSMLTDVVALRVPHATGSLSKAMHQIVDGEVKIRNNRISDKLRVNESSRRGAPPRVYLLRELFFI